jgi:hypothetical protein
MYGASIGSPLLFVRGDVRAKSTISCMERRLVAPYFLYAVTVGTLQTGYPRIQASR